MKDEKQNKEIGNAEPGDKQNEGIENTELDDKQLEQAAGGIGTRTIRTGFPTAKT